LQPRLARRIGMRISRASLGFHGYQLYPRALRQRMLVTHSSAPSACEQMAMHCFRMARPAASSLPRMRACGALCPSGLYTDGQKANKCPRIQIRIPSESAADLLVDLRFRPGRTRGLAWRTLPRKGLPTALPRLTVALQRPARPRTGTGPQLGPTRSCLVTLMILDFGRVVAPPRLAN
jgi:hypothetical protein